MHLGGLLSFLGLIIDDYSYRSLDRSLSHLPAAGLCPKHALGGDGLRVNTGAPRWKTSVLDRLSLAK